MIASGARGAEAVFASIGVCAVIVAVLLAVWWGWRDR